MRISSLLQAVVTVSYLSHHSSQADELSSSSFIKETQHQEHSFAEEINQNWRQTSQSFVQTDDDDNELEKVNMRDMPMPDDNEETFCEGMYMTMFMDGLQFSLGRNSTKKPSCLNYFVSTWRLENSGKFKGAMVFTFLLAILVEALSSLRGVIVCHKNPKLQPYLMTLNYGVQGCMGYILMLIAMSFSVELILSVIFGLMTGNLLFMRYDGSTRTTRSNRTAGQNPHASSDAPGEVDRREMEPLIASPASGQRQYDKRNSGTLRRRA